MKMTIEESLRKIQDRAAMLEYFANCAATQAAPNATPHVMSGIGDVCEEMHRMARGVRRALTPDAGDIEVSLADA